LWAPLACTISEKYKIIILIKTKNSVQVSVRE